MLWEHRMGAREKEGEGSQKEGGGRGSLSEVGVPFQGQKDLGQRRSGLNQGGRCKLE